MGHVLGQAIKVTLWVWVAAEIGLQMRQLLHSEHTERTEWRTLVVFPVLIAAGIELAGPVRHAVPALSYRVTAPFALIVLLVAWAGIALRLWAIITLGRFFRGTVHIQQHHQVVTSGPYRWVRHPAYSGILLAAAALSLIMGNVASWAVFMVCCLLATCYRIRVEERVLTEALGTAYTDYAARTRRLIPKVW
ncbi:MAG: isoprenylcysteine carboxylmethyltransferase family protein [Streptomycetaceae bacterium]|nr:isoprenylcysteine carboxylmethyltransferase family protein [Streptomycetaceae bacterium]